MALNYMHKACRKAKHDASLMLQYTKSTLVLLEKKSITASTEAVFVSISSYFNSFTMCLSILHAITRYGNKTKVDSFPRTPLQLNIAERDCHHQLPKLPEDACFSQSLPTSVPTTERSKMHIKYLACDPVAENIH